MGIKGGHDARSLWPRDNTTSEGSTLKTFVAILCSPNGIPDTPQRHYSYLHIKQLLTTT